MIEVIPTNGATDADDPCTYYAAEADGVRFATIARVAPGHFRYTIPRRYRGVWSVETFPTAEAAAQACHDLP